MHHIWWAYVAVGVATLLAIFIAHQRSKNPDLLYNRKNLSANNPMMNKTWLIFLSEVAVPFFAAIAIVILWPMAWGLWAQEHWLKRTLQKVHPEFTVKRTDLVAATTVESAESGEYVVDPLLAVPDLPFGHLNFAWKSFVEQRGDSDALWSFSSNWVNRWGDVELHAGYVWVSGRVAKRYFLTEHRALAEGDLPNKSWTPAMRYAENIKC